MSVNPGVGNKLTDNTFTRENYTFTGWNTAADGTGDTYADGAIVNFSANTTLYAQWTQNPVITFDANGGKGIMGTQTVNPGVSAALPANTFTRADYDFAGWNTKADGTARPMPTRQTSPPTKMSPSTPSGPCTSTMSAGSI